MLRRVSTDWQNVFVCFWSFYVLFFFGAANDFIVRAWSCFVSESAVRLSWSSWSASEAPELGTHMMQAIEDLGSNREPSYAKLVVPNACCEEKIRKVSAAPKVRREMWDPSWLPASWVCRRSENCTSRVGISSVTRLQMVQASSWHPADSSLLHWNDPPWLAMLINTFWRLWRTCQVIVMLGPLDTLLWFV